MTPSQPRRSRTPGVAIAVLLAAIAAVILYDMSRLQLTSAYGVGPKMMPIVVAIGFVVLALANLVMALRGGLPEPESAQATPILLILGGLAAVIALIGFGGGVIAAVTVLFVTTSAAFGRRGLVSDALIGFGLGVAVFILFDKLLTLSLPAGPIERLF
jgi:putative tricarboxylic transport membrane protein